MGRATVLDVEDVGLALQAAEGNMSAAARILDTSPSNVYHYVEKYPELVPLSNTRRLDKTKKNPTSKPEELAAAITLHRGVLTLVAEEVGLGSPAAVMYHVRTNPQVREAFEAARGAIIDKAQVNVFDAVEEGDLKQSNWLLDRLGKDMGYAVRTEIDKRVEYVNNVDGASTAQLLSALHQKIGTEDGLEIKEGEFEEVVNDIASLAEAPANGRISEVPTEALEAVAEGAEAEQEGRTDPVKVEA